MDMMDTRPHATHTHTCIPPPPYPKIHTEFKRTASSDVFKAVSGLIRAYQEEIDKLSTRAKFAETAFLDVYQRLYEAPDPAPALATALVGVWCVLV